MQSLNFIPVRNSKIPCIGSTNRRRIGDTFKCNTRKCFYLPINDVLVPSNNVPSSRSVDNFSFKSVTDGQMEYDQIQTESTESRKFISMIHIISRKINQFDNSNNNVNYFADVKSAGIIQPSIGKNSLININNGNGIVHSETFTKLKPGFKNECGCPEVATKENDVVVTEQNFDEKIRNMLLKTLETQDFVINTPRVNESQKEQSCKLIESNKSIHIPHNDQITSTECVNEIAQSLPKSMTLSSNKSKPESDISMQEEGSLIDVDGLNDINATTDDVNIASILKSLLNNKSQQYLKSHSPIKEDLTFAETDEFDVGETMKEKPKVLKFFNNLPNTYTKIRTKVFSKASSQLDTSSKPVCATSEKYEINSLINMLQENRRTGDKAARIVKPNPCSHIRAFTVDPFDNLVKSHLSPRDRRLVAISKKVNCNIKLIGPQNPRNPARSRNKSFYNCYLISENRESVEKCLKCIQDCFPSTRLFEINVPASIF